jgi:prepilin-type processing-associated H-X9-DG protein
VSAPNIRAVITANKAKATNGPPGTNALMLDGHNTDGRANQARNETSPSHGDPMSAFADGVSARPKAVSHTIPTVRYAIAAASTSLPSRATVRGMVAR